MASQEEEGTKLKVKVAHQGEEKADVTSFTTPWRWRLHLRESELLADEVRSRGSGSQEIAPESISTSACGLDANLFVCSPAVSLYTPRKDQLSLSPSLKKITAE